jgi:hypothetical protein
LPGPDFIKSQAPIVTLALLVSISLLLLLVCQQKNGKRWV